MEDGAAGRREVLSAAALDGCGDTRRARVRRGTRRARDSRRAGARARRHARCISFEGFRFAVFARRGGRAPEIEDATRSNGSGASSGASTRSARSSRFASGRRSISQSFGDEPREYPARRTASSRAICATAYRERRASRRWKACERCFERAGEVAHAAPARRLSRRATCCGPTPARISSISTTAAWARRSRTCGCCCRASAPRQSRAAGRCARRL